MKGTCMYCETEIEIKMCCSGRDCGCMGQPVEPPICESEECWQKFSKEHHRTNTPMSEEQNILLMPFYDDTPNFTNGFECGQIWEKLQNGEKLENYLCHTCNLKQIQKIADSFLTEIEINEGEEWSTFSTKEFKLLDQ